MSQNLSIRAAEAIPAIDTRTPEDVRWWAALNARMAAHSERLAASLVRTTAHLDELEAGHRSDAEFHDRWNAMSYREAVEFQRARTQEPTPC